MKAINDDIKAKNEQIATLEKQILDFILTSHETLDKSDIVQVRSHCQVLQRHIFLSFISQADFSINLQAVAELRDQLNEKSFELEVIQLFLFTQCFFIYCHST